MTPTTSIKSKNNDKLCDTKVRLLCEEAEQEISHLYDIFDILVPKKIETNEAQTTKSINNNETSNMSNQDDDEEGRVMMKDIVPWDLTQGDIGEDFTHFFSPNIFSPKKIETNEAQTTKSINNNETSNMSSKTTTYQDDDEWEENLPLCQLLEPKTRPPSWKWRKTFSKLVVPEIELDWLQNMRLLAKPPPPPQTAEFGWGSQQEANKTKMKKTKTKTKTNKTKKDKKDKKEKNEYHFDDFVKSNILSFINQPPLVKIVSNEWWKKNRCDVLYREIEVNGRHSSVVTTQYRDVTRHIDTRKTKKALGIKGAGKLKVFVEYDDKEDFDERAQTQIVYKYGVCALPSHPLGKHTEWGFMAKCPQGKAYVVFK